MTSERIKEIQETTAYPNSVSVKQALLQVWNECCQEQSRQADVSGSLPDELLLAAIKYGYDYHSTTSFPNESFEVNMLGNALQWIENHRQ